MNGLALCAGIGGLELGLSQAIPGYRTVCHVEKDPYAAAVLATRIEAGDLPCAPVYSDIRSFDGSPWSGVVDLISAGYPCQPFSLAGQRGGDTDTRHVWPEIARVIREVGPRVVFLENVPGHLSLGFSEVLGDLASAGFNAEWGLFSAAEVGAPHLRNRVFVLAYSKRCDLRVKPGRSRGEGRQGTPLPGFNGANGESWASWAASTNSSGEDDGVPSRVDRLRCLGNAVVPAQAAHAFRELYRRAYRYTPLSS